jgi:splicing factor U2AF subunit
MFTYGPGRIPPPAHLGVPEQLIVGSFPPSGDHDVQPLSSIRQAKRLYIGGFTEAMKNEDLLKFFNDLMKEKDLAKKDEAGDPITEASVNAEKAFAFLEVSSVVWIVVLS